MKKADEVTLDEWAWVLGELGRLYDEVELLMMRQPSQQAVEEALSQLEKTHPEMVENLLTTRAAIRRFAESAEMMKGGIREQTREESSKG